MTDLDDLNEDMDKMWVKLNSLGNLPQAWLEAHNKINEMNDRIDDLKRDIEYIRNGLRYHANHDFFRDHMLENRLNRVERKNKIVPPANERLQWLIDHRLTFDEIEQVKKAIKNET